MEQGKTGDTKKSVTKTCNGENDAKAEQPDETQKK